MSFLELYISAIILWTVFYFVGRILFEKDDKENILKVVLCIMGFSVALSYLNYINSEILHGILKILCVYNLYCLFYKIIFGKSWSKVFTASLILYLCLCASEIITVLIASYVLELFNNSIIFMKNNIVLNIIIALLNYAIIKVANKKLTYFVKNSNLNMNSHWLIILIILITLALLIFRIPLNEWKLDLEFIITMSILLCFCFIGLYLLKQSSDMKKTKSMYQQLVDYSDITNSLLEDYRVVSHEHKNQISIIRGMIDENNKELVDYIDNLIEKRDIIKYQWIGELNHLPLSGLKGLINYKLIEMEKYKINTNILISKDLSKIKLNKLNTKQKDALYSIMGVYLDNAIQATKNSKKKEISLEMYKDKKEVVVVLANTYKGNIDLDKIDNYGYTTKGKNHGVGLHIVKKILEEETIFTQSRSLFDEYYVQELRINLSKIK